LSEFFLKKTKNKKIRSRNGTEQRQSKITIEIKGRILRLNLTFYSKNSLKNRTFYHPPLLIPARKAAKARCFAIAMLMQRGIVPEQKEITSEQMAIVPEQKGIAPEQMGIASEQKGITPEQKGIASEQMAIGGLQKGIGAQH
jgi:hypothetical protein